MSEDTSLTAPVAISENNNKKYAGFWMRFWAYLADLIIVFSINGLILSPFHLFGDMATYKIGLWTVTGILSTLVFYLYFVLMTKYFQQTLGKMIFGLKVIRTDGESLEWGNVIFREVVGRFLHRVFFICIVLYLVVGFTSEKEGIHDLIADTRVIFDR
ncbi:RDD family protein [Oceanobacillus piezotolerans]|uniref:RDD family protein n=1 Tax=Oceanobacillus piezotolerans TaxID=2448030 RepID=A0A498DEE9_9BACI|nr:RDD family protein [Oceanobacillus piezotolerans]RLL41759.1 RDD family protein [Oceanobacillus piezotolerans]